MRETPSAFRVQLLTAGAAPGSHWGDLGSSQHVLILLLLIALSIKCRSTHGTGEVGISDSVLEESHKHHFLLSQRLDELCGLHLTLQHEWPYSAAPGQMECGPKFPVLASQGTATTVLLVRKSCLPLPQSQAADMSPKAVQ